MFDQQFFAKYGLTARILLTLSIPLLFVVLRSLLRRREDRRLVRTRAQAPVGHLLNY